MDLGTAAEVRQHFRKKQLDAQEAAMADIVQGHRESIERLLTTEPKESDGR